MSHDTMLERAQDYVSTGDMTAANALIDRLLATASGDVPVLAAAERLLQRNPQHVAALIAKGRLLLQKEEKKQAASLLEKAGKIMAIDGHRSASVSLWQSAVDASGGEPLRQWMALVERQAKSLPKQTLKDLWVWLADRHAANSDDGYLLEYLGNKLYDMHDFENALPLYKKAYALGRRDPKICNLIGLLLAYLFRNNEAVSWFRKAENLPYDKNVAYWKARVIQFSGQGSQKEVNRLWDRWGREFFAHAPPRPPMPLAQRPLRLGFCCVYFEGGNSWDLLASQHALALARRGVEVQLYITDNVYRSENPVSLPKLPGCQWVDLTKLNPSGKAQAIRNDRLHALIDFDWVPINRTIGLFMCRPAPLVINIIHPISSHGGAADCLMMDDWLCPPGAEAGFSERILRVKELISWTLPDPLAPAVTPPPCLKQGFITFGSFNRPYKLDEATLAAWIEVMKQMPNSRLLLRSRSFNEYETDRVGGILRRLGLAPERFEILSETTIDDFLASYGRVDIALDPLEYNGGATSLDALWQGVPVFTCPGRPDQLVVSRIGASLLTAIGRPEWIARDPADWRRMVVEAASDYDRLRRWRFELRPQIARSVVCDTERRADIFLGAITPVIDEHYRKV